MRVAIAVLCFLVASCSSVRVTGIGVLPGADATPCSDFRLTDTQAAAYFRHAKPVSAHEFNFAPCIVRGVDGTSTFEINALLGASRTTADGTLTWFACDETCTKAVGL